MKCSNCGNEIDNSAAICVHCGAPTARGMSMGTGFASAPVDPDEPANTDMIVLSLLVPLFGIVFGAIESGNGKKRAGKTYIICGVSVMVGLTALMLIFMLIGMILPFIIVALSAAFQM